MTPELQQFLMEASGRTAAGNLQVREHAWYRTTNGAVIGPAVHDPDPDGGLFNWRIGDHYFSHSGLWSDRCAGSQYDLVAEVEPTDEDRQKLRVVLDEMLRASRDEARRWRSEGLSPLVVAPGRYYFGWTTADGRHHTRKVCVVESDGFLWMRFADDNFKPYDNAAHLPISLLPDSCEFLQA